MKDSEYNAQQAGEQVTRLQKEIDAKQAEIDNATKTFEARLDPESAQQRAESNLALAKMYQDAAAENLEKVKAENKDNVTTDYLGTALGGIAGVSEQIGAKDRGETVINKTNISDYQYYTPEARAAVDKAEQQYKEAQANTAKAMLAKDQAYQLSKYNPDAELSRIKAQQTQAAK